jgi:dienelactone hydrolase
VPLSGSPDGGKWPGRNALGPVRLLQTRVAGQPDVLLFQTTRTRDRRGNGEGFGAFQLNLREMQQTRVATLPVHDGQIITGPQHRVALAHGVDAENREVVYYLPPAAREGGRDWQLVASSDKGQRGLRPISWTGTGEEYFALDGRDSPTRAVVIWNAADNTRRVLYSHPSVDMDSAGFDPSGRAYVFFGNNHFPLYWYPDPEHPLARLHRIVVQKVRNEMVEVVSASDDLAVAVVRVSSGRRPPVFLAVDTKTANSVAGFFEFPTLRGTRLAKVEPIVVQTRGGLIVRGYLTTPEDASGRPRRNLPLVVIAHDGPLGEPSSIAYEYERQLFASRGYAVLQINRRGSPGLGAAYQRAGDGKWGEEIQDDFIDGVYWAIKDGVANASRVCFYGRGYGAYSAMVAAAREPDLFKCVIGVQGVYDLPRMLPDGEKAFSAAMTQVLGTDLAELKARSPVSLARAIKAKVLLMPQQKGQNFPAEQTTLMRNALRDAGKTPQVILQGQEMAGQHSTNTRSNGYAAMLKFLEQNIGH